MYFQLFVVTKLPRLEQINRSQMIDLNLLFLLVPCSPKLATWFMSYNQSKWGSFSKLSKNVEILPSLKWWFLESFFSKCYKMKTNEDKDMKPTAKDHKYPEILSKERNFLLSPSILEQENFKVWTEVEVGIPIFWWEIFPYLESSLVVLKSA